MKITQCECGWTFHNGGRPRIRECPSCGASVQLAGVMPAVEKKLSGRWPAWALLVSIMKNKKDAGVGDTFKRMASVFGGEVYRKITKALGMPCKCQARLRLWNERYPYA